MLVCVVSLLVAAQVARAAPARFGYEREIDSHRPRLFQYILGEDNFTLKDRAKLITKPIPEDAVASDNVIVESNVLHLVPKRVRRGYNLENVIVPAAYPYLPVPQYSGFTRFRRRNDDWYPRWY